MLKVRTLFSGIGSPESALKNIGIDYELVDFCEIDKYAVKSYCAMHNVSEDKNLGDISKVWGRNLPYADLMVWGFPCTDISLAGKQSGIVEGKTRSGLYYEGLRILGETKPKYSIIENVKNLTGKRFKAEFEQMLEDIKELGYNNYWKVLNAKDYGIPQNRQRVFIVSIRKDVDTERFEFPKEFNNGLKLKDFLEENVDGKYYLKNVKDFFIKNSFDMEQKGNGFRFEPHVYDKANIAKTLTTRCGGRMDDNFIIYIKSNLEKFKFDSTNKELAAIREATKQGYAIAAVGDSINLEQPNSLTRRGRVGHEVAQTLTCSCNQATLEPNYKIRKLTPLECYRLMGFTDEEFEKAAAVNSNAQLYKQAGNSIVTNVLANIFSKLLQADIQANIDEDKILG